MTNPDSSAEDFARTIDLAREPDFALGRILVRPSICELKAGENCPVEPKVMQALVALAQRKGEVVSRDELVQRCWGGRAVGEDAINRCIAKVRRLQDLDARASFEVETIPRVGYRLLENAAAIASRHSVPTAGTRSGMIADVEGTAGPSVTGRRGRIVAGAGAFLLMILVGAIFLWHPAQPAVMEAGYKAANSEVESAANAGLPAGAVFKDCTSGCPEMVVIPSGYFLMGLSRQEMLEIPRDSPSFFDNQGPQHEVLIGRRFAMAKYDVTREEYALFVSETNRPAGPSCQTLTHQGIFVETMGAGWRRPGFQQTSRDPVVCVSWSDAVAYTEWLAHKTSKPYRLPTEAEWEYAARAARFQRPEAKGPDRRCQSFNGADASYHAVFTGDGYADLTCSDGYSATSPVGSFPPNAFGLYDVLGNVMQWTLDCYHESYDGAPVDGSVWLSGDCGFRVARGGYWALDMRSISYGFRNSAVTNDRFSANGFRVVRGI